MTTSELAHLTSRIRELLDAGRKNAWQIAHLIDQARREQFPDRGLDWLQWCAAEFGFSRRYAFLLARCITFCHAVETVDSALVRRVQPAALGDDAAQVLEDLHLTKVEILADIPPARLRRFLDHHDCRRLTRDEIRAAVSKFLHRPAALSPILLYRRIPDPDLLIAGLDDPAARERLDPELEVRYVAAHMRRLSVVYDTMTPEQLGYLRNNLMEDCQLLELLLRKAIDRRETQEAGR